MNPGGDPQVPQRSYAPDALQRIALGGMVALVIITFLAANLQAFLWQSSSWLVSTVLPAVVVDLTNEERVSYDEAPLRRNATLDEAARLKAEHMAQNEYFAHYAPDGTSPWHWFDEAGYVYAHAGENLAIHFTDSAEVVEAWMKSPKHKENIVDTDFTEIGVGTAKGEFEGYETVYVVQLFGTPATPRVPQPQPVAVAAPIPSPNPSPVPVATPEPTEAPNETVLSAESSPEAEPTPQLVSEVVPTTTIPQIPAAEETPSSETVVIQSTMIATSSGLAVATVYEEPTPNKGAMFGLATQPNGLLERIYTILAGMVVGLLIISAVMEVRRRRYIQMAYSFALLLVMGGMWFVHSLLTAGAVIV